jgi:hypothetical protein
VQSRPQDRIRIETLHLTQVVAHTDDDVDGFDLTVGEGAHRLRFDLQIEGLSRAAEVNIGPENIHPPENPFVVRLQEDE